MGKFDAARRLSKKEINELFADFAKALASVRTPVEAANFVKDLLTEAEVVILARRLQIARLLQQNLTYGQIHRTMKVGNSTVAKVHAWMDLYGDGYRTVIKRTKTSSRKTNHASPMSFARHRKNYPIHYWPEMLLQKMIESASTKEKKKLLAAVSAMKAKTKLNKEITALLQPVQKPGKPKR